MLLVEDNATIRKVTLVQLQRLGYCADSVDSGLAAGMDDYLGKPVILAELEATLARCLPPTVLAVQPAVVDAVTA